MNRRNFLELLAGTALLEPEVLAERRSASLKGSRASMDKQNLEAQLENLTKIENAEQLEVFVKHGLLVKLPENNDVTVDSSLPKWRRYARPWTVEFLRDLGRDHKKVFRNSRALVVSSAVRPKSLGKVNSNASPRSVHPTGSTIDLNYSNMSSRERKWVGDRLLTLEKIGAVEATKETNQPCFHFMVFKNYPVKKKLIYVKK